MMKLFIDCEFEDLNPEAKLISIALVAEDGNYFYSELTDTYNLRDCSNFVMEHVLPYLKNENKMTFSECSFEIAKWIEDRNQECILACDNVSWDLPYLKKLLEPVWPENLKKDDIFKFIIMEDVADRIISENNLQIHNALDDAKCMMLANHIGECWEY